MVEIKMQEDQLPVSDPDERAPVISGPNFEHSGAFNKTLKESPFLQTTWDSTSLGALKTCPYKYYLEIVLGWRSRVQSEHLTFGSIYHEALETYERVMASQAYSDTGHEIALRAAVRKVLTQCYKKKFFGFKTKTPLTLLRSVVWYLDHYGINDPAKTYMLSGNIPAVEHHFEFSSGITSMDTQHQYFLAGHLDRVVEFQDALYIADYKTTGTALSSSWFDRFTPDNQMTFYTLAGTVSLAKPVKGVIIDGAQIAVGFTRYARGFANRTSAHQEEWLDSLKYYLRHAEMYAAEGSWPQNDMACSHSFCPFVKICAADPGVREMYLKGDFVQRLWDPTKARTALE